MESVLRAAHKDGLPARRDFRCDFVNTQRLSYLE